MATARERLKQDTRQRVLDTAARLFRERGSADITVREIAQASGVSAGTVMTVGDKNALVVHAFDRLVAAEHAQHDPGEPDVPSAATCSDRLTDCVRPFVVIFTSQPVLARVYASILVTGEHDSHLFTDLADRLREEFARAITRHGCSPSDSAPAVASALYFAYVGVLFSWAAQNSHDPNVLLERLRAAFATICTCQEAR